MHQLLYHLPIISDQISQSGLDTLLTALDKVIAQKVPGDIVEFGCYIGTTSMFIRRLLDLTGQSNQRHFHVYDSFAGLPAKSAADQSSVGTDFQAGELSISRKRFLAGFKKAQLAPPISHKSWFNQLKPGDIPNHISFAFLDGDFYQSIIDSLQLVWPRLSRGGVIAIDDYQREALPGVTKAVEEFFQIVPIRILHQQQIALITAP